MTERILIFGSRHWRDEAAIRSRLLALPADTVLIVGDCETGADEIAYRIWHDELGRHGWRFVAHWRGPKADAAAAARYGYDPAAGPKRNQRMIDVGKPTRAIGFRRAGPSPGTDDMRRRLEASLIPYEMVYG